MDIQAIRDEFPITCRKFPVLGSDEPQPLIYFDHGASTHAPRPVLDAHLTFLEHYYANIHRASHHLSLIASDLFDNVTKVIADFIGGDLRHNAVLYSQNTTSALDMASHMMASQPGIVLATIMEHHSNDLPHRRRGPVIHAEVQADGRLDMEDLQRKLTGERVKLVAVTGASNVTGLMPDIHLIAEMAHARGARILVDAAQLLAHYPLDVRADDDPRHLDFVAGAGHKAYAPFGSAFLFGPLDLMNAAEPYMPGGGTVIHAFEDQVLWQKTPLRHQGGTPNVPGAIAMATALQYLKRIGISRIREHEQALTAYALQELTSIQGVTVYGPPEAQDRLGVISFNIRGLSHALVAAILNYEAGIATRNGRFCAHSYFNRLLGIADTAHLLKQQTGCGSVDVPGAVRATFGLYNTLEEVGHLVAMVRRIARREWQGEYLEEPGVPVRPVNYPERQMPLADWALSPF